ncbi:hypothetical protein HYU96_05030 [Candidatus Daviesbacteria bacterium]|nr:hypothetical protein [Candidatus Daviesbacteria bacterium]
MNPDDPNQNQGGQTPPAAPVDQGVGGEQPAAPAVACVKCGGNAQNGVCSTCGQNEQGCTCMPSGGAPSGDMGQQPAPAM